MPIAIKQFILHLLIKYFFKMLNKPELVTSTPEGGTIHKYELSGGKRDFMRYLCCYLGSCKFCNDLEEANDYLKSISLAA